MRRAEDVVESHAYLEILGPFWVVRVRLWDVPS
jgi:hypothetical protein